MKDYDMQTMRADEIVPREVFADVLDADEVVVGAYKPNKRRYYKAFWMFALPIFWPHLIMIFILTLGVVPILYVKRGYDHLYYAYTNKRVLARSGSFGVTYRSIDYRDVVSTEVSVSFLDRRTDTGSISFQTQRRSLTFNFIEKPYDVLREIREYIAHNA